MKPGAEIKDQLWVVKQQLTNGKKTSEEYEYGHDLHSKLLNGEIEIEGGGGGEEPNRGKREGKSVERKT